MKLTKRIVALGLVILLALGTIISYLPASNVVVADSVSDDDSDISHVTVHDPSIVVGYVESSVTSLTSSTKIVGEQSDTYSKEVYFIFGSHLAWAWSWDMVDWTTFTNNINSNYITLFANEFAWSSLGDSVYAESGNMWAPDVIWNEEMGKWCMYMSINGVSWNSSICMLTADSLYGSWTYVGTVIYSGFTTSDYSYDFSNTDYTKVTGDTTLASRYIRDAYTCKDNGTACSTTTWNTAVGGHAIDPCVFYDEDGVLWMSYGSWSGGIYMIQLDESTGLRDYTVTYSQSDGSSTTLTSDPYCGYRIAGGSGVSGEASYIRYIDGYYYLFVTYGSLTAAGGYNMRVFRSKTVNGLYKDESGDDARYSVSHGAGTTSGTVGMRLMSYYKWSFQNYAQVAQGHNSVYVADDGSIYLIYHRRTNDGTEGHEVRVHQLFLNADGWLVTAPFEYTEADEISEDGYEVSEIAGSYEVLLQDPAVDYASLSYVAPSYIVLNEDGSVTGDYTGTWTLSSGKPYITLVVGGETYRGVCLTQAIEGKTSTTMTFTAVGTSSEVALWGYCYDDELAVEMEVAGIEIPAQTVNGTDLTMNTEGTYGTTITWKSSNEDVIATDGTVTEPEGENVTVILTATITKGDVTHSETYSVEVLGTNATDEDGNITVWSSGSTYDLTGAAQGDFSFPNYFNSEIGTAGLELYSGVEIEFTATRTGSYNYLSNILSFNVGGDNSANIMYFTGGSYLGYNATGGYFDANVNYWSSGTDYIGSNTETTIKIVILPYTYEVYVDGVLAYSMDTVTAGTTAGYNSIDTIYSVLTYLSGTATEFELGWGAWDSWGNVGFAGTISDITLTALALTEDATDVVGYLYKENYSDIPATSGTGTGWISTNAQSALSVKTDSYETVDWYLNYATDSGNGNRGAYLNFNDGEALATGSYTVSVDVAITPGQNSGATNQFAILGTDSAYTSKNINYGIDSGYILLLSSSGSNSTTYYINGTDDTVTIPSGTWVTINAYVYYATDNTPMVYVVISNRETGAVLYEGEQAINGSGDLKGLYLLRGRTNGSAKVDNIGVSYSVGSLTSDGTANSLTWNYLPNFFKLSAEEDFTLNWNFYNYTQGGGNYQNYALCITETTSDKYWSNYGDDSTTDWYLRADCYSNAVFGDGTNSDISYTNNWANNPETVNEDWAEWLANMDGAYVEATLTREAGVLTFTATITAEAGTVYTYSAVTNEDASSTAEALDVYLGGESCYLLIESYEVESTDVCSYDDGEVTDPTCAAEGYTTYTCIYCGETVTDDYTTAEDAHDWDYGSLSNDSIEWAEDYSASITYYCKNDSSHSVTVEATVTSEGSGATCTTAGYTTYTAKVTVNGTEYTSTKTVTEAALGHDYGDDWTWTETEDGYTASVTLTCSRNDDKQTIDATVTPVTKPATCEKDGSIVYTATATYNDVEYSDTYTVTLGALGHDWDYDSLTDDSIVWASDYSNASITYYCKNDSSHSVTAKATVTSVETDATCEEDGSIVYTATVEVNGVTYTSIQTVVLDALGHAYGEPSFTWDTSSTVPSVTAAVECTREGCDSVLEGTLTYENLDGTAVPMDNDAVVSYTSTTAEDGSVAYTVTYVLDSEEYSSHITISAVVSGDTDVRVVVEDDEAVDETVSTAVADSVEEALSGSTVSSEDVVTTYYTPAIQVFDSTTGTWSDATDDTIEDGADITISYPNETNSGYTFVVTAYYSNGTTENLIATLTDSGIQVNLTSVPDVIAISYVCEHDYEGVVITEATCEEDGLMEYTCSICGDTYTEVIPATGHDWDYENAQWVWASDNSSATMTVSCTNDSSHTTIYEAVVTSVVTDTATVYTATVTIEGTEYTNSVEVEIAVETESEPVETESEPEETESEPEETESEPEETESEPEETESEPEETESEPEETESESETGDTESESADSQSENDGSNSTSTVSPKTADTTLPITVPLIVLIGFCGLAVVERNRRSEGR